MARSSLDQLAQALAKRKRYDPNNNPWDPPLRQYFPARRTPNADHERANAGALQSTVSARPIPLAPFRPRRRRV